MFSRDDDHKIPFLQRAASTGEGGRLESAMTALREQRALTVTRDGILERGVRWLPRPVFKPTLKSSFFAPQPEHVALDELVAGVHSLKSSWIE
jgi:hypothetical protein